MNFAKQPNKEEKGYAGLGKSEAAVSQISQILQENICVGVSFLIKLLASNFIKRDYNTDVFLRNLLKFLRKPLFIEHLRWLLLKNLFGSSREKATRYW